MQIDICTLSLLIYQSEHPHKTSIGCPAHAGTSSPLASHARWKVVNHSRLHSGKIAVKMVRTGRIFGKQVNFLGLTK